MNNPDAPSGLPRLNVFVAPPFLSYPMSSISNRSGIKLKPFSLFPHDILHEQPWRAALVALVGLPARGFFFPPSGTSDSSVLRPGLQEGLARFFFFFSVVVGFSVSFQVSIIFCFYFSI